MANNTYDVVTLTPTTDTVEVFDDGTGSDWLSVTGTYPLPTDIRLTYWFESGHSTQAAARYEVSPGQAHNLIVHGLIENVRGSNSADSISGNEANNTLLGDQATTGVGGSDTIGADLGNDIVYGCAGGDNLSGDEGDDKLYGGAGSDSIAGDFGKDTLIGGTGADTLSGGADGTDMVSYTDSNAGVTVRLTFGQTTAASGGTAAGDHLNGFNRATGSDFADLIVDTVKGTVAFGGNENIFYGGDGNDRLVLGGGDDAGYGGFGEDRLYGEAARDRLYGDDSDDQLFGGAGRDTLVGGQGADLLTGGGDADRFVFRAVTDSTQNLSQRDTIVDFHHSQGDRIDLRDIDAVPGGFESAFTFRDTGAFTGAGQIRLVISNAGVTVQGNLDADATAEFSIFVAGVNDLVAHDFML